jgi:hypothetical protein
MSMKPGAGTWRIDGGVGSPIHTPERAHIEDKRTHPANGTPSDTAGKPPPWRSRPETDPAFGGTMAGAPIYTTCWGVLNQPDNQKATRDDL